MPQVGFIIEVQSWLSSTLLHIRLSEREHLCPERGLLCNHCLVAQRQANPEQRWANARDGNLADRRKSREMSDRSLLPKIRRELFDEALLLEINCFPPTAEGLPIAYAITSTMISRSSLARTAQQAARRSCGVQRRTFAAAASTGSYETSDVTGLKIASRDAHGPTTKLAIVAKAGTRFQPLPGLTVGLEEFAFKVRKPGIRRRDLS